jgi:hypothetical protein
MHRLRLLKERPFPESAKRKTGMRKDRAAGHALFNRIIAKVDPVSLEKDSSDKDSFGQMITDYFQA